MFDSSKLISKFHNDSVRLSSQQQKDMKDKRDANVRRLKSGLDENKKPVIVETINQGGYAMNTMTQPPEGDEESRYDIDMGVVFEESDSKGPKTTKQWVADAIALKATNMKHDPEVKPKCVRIIYADGYQVDLPVFKRTVYGDEFVYYLATNDDWYASKPQQFNSWFEKEVAIKSPEDSSPYQLRQLVRLFKYFSKTKAFHENRKYPAGLVTTTLAVECYVPAEGRIDLAFFETLKNMATRSEYSSVAPDGVVISDDKDIERIKRLREAADYAVGILNPIFDSNDNFTEEEARKIWKKVFRHSFFDVQKAIAPEIKSAVSVSTALAAPAVLTGANDRNTLLESAISDVKATTGGTKPWAKS